MERLSDRDLSRPTSRISPLISIMYFSLCLHVRSLVPSCGCVFNPAPYPMCSLWFSTVSPPILLSQCTSLLLTFAHFPLGLCLSVPVSLSLFCTVAACPLSFCPSPTPHISCLLFLSINLFTACLLHLPLSCLSAPLTNPPHLFPLLSPLTLLISQLPRLPRLSGAWLLLLVTHSR